MTQNEKDLLLKDLCARLPYFTKVQIKNEIVVLNSICDDDGYHFNFIGDNREGVNIEEIKPYLFPISSMTEEQNKELSEILFNLEMEHLQDNETGFTIKGSKVAQSEIDWYNKNHFDYRGLILMGLAIDATGKNIY